MRSVTGPTTAADGTPHHHGPALTDARDAKRAARPKFTDPPKAAQSAVVPDVLCLADVEPAEVAWLWPGRIPLGRITLLVGRPGAGKSFLTCDAAARLSTGAPWPCGGPAPAGDTLLIAAEDDPADTIAPRLVAAGADRRRVHLLRAAVVTTRDGERTSVAFDLSNVELIRATLAERPGVRLVVVDPVGSYLGGGGDAHRDNEVRGVLAPLAQLASERRVAVLLVCHTRKAEAAFADDTALGSRAFVGLARSVLHLLPDPHDRDRKLLLPGKSNLTAAAAGLAYRIAGDPPRLEWEPDPLDGVHADDLMTAGAPAPGRGPAPDKRDAAVGWLTELLRPGPRPTEEVKAQAKAAGLAWPTVRRAAEGLGIRPRKQGFNGGWAWVFPDEGSQVDARRCSTPSEPEHLRWDEGKQPTPAAENGEGAHGPADLSTFAAAYTNGDTSADPPPVWDD